MVLWKIHELDVEVVSRFFGKFKFVSSTRIMYTIIGSSELQLYTHAHKINLCPQNVVRRHSRHEPRRGLRHRFAYQCLADQRRRRHAQTSAIPLPGHRGDDPRPALLLRRRMDPVK